VGFFIIIVGFFKFCFVCLLYYCRGFIFIFIPIFCFSFCTINFTITIFSSLTSHTSCSLLLLCYNPLLSFPTTLSAPSHPLSFPAFTSASHTPQTCHQTTPPFYTLTTYWPTYCTNFTQYQPPTIPDISTLHYNRNTSKHTQESQNPVVPTLLPLFTHLTSCLSF
jgi:hypothetical protein